MNRFTMIMASTSVALTFGLATTSLAGVAVPGNMYDRSEVVGESMVELVGGNHRGCRDHYVRKWGEEEPHRHVGRHRRPKLCRLWADDIDEGETGICFQVGRVEICPGGNSD